MNSGQRKEYIIYRLEKATETFEVAELLINNKKWNSAVNRLYYAAYYAISALLFQAEINTKTHSGVKTQFFLHYIKTNIIEIESGKVYSDLLVVFEKNRVSNYTRVARRIPLLNMDI